MKTLIKYNIKRKWGEGKVFLVSLLCVALTGLLPLQAEANDTRNRVLIQAINAPYEIRYDRERDPYTGSSENWVNVIESDNFNLTFRVFKDGLEITTPMIFEDYYPAESETVIRFPILTAAVHNLEYGTINLDGADNGMITEYTSISYDNMNFMQKAEFKGKANHLATFSPYGNHGRVNFKPNTKYYLYLDDMKSLKTRTVRDTRRVWLYYRPGLGRAVGYANSTNSSNTFNEAQYKILNNKSGAKYFRDESCTDIFYTPADDPSIGVSNVTTDTATISWDTNNTNPEGTSYTLQYQQLKENGNPSNEADWGTQWHTITINGANTTTLKATTQSIFSQDNTYRLRVQVNHIGGQQYNVYSDYVIFSTSADPAVRAAYEAAIAAQAAKKAAEDGVSYALDAKTAAEDAKTAAVNAEKKSVEIYNLVAKMPPKVNKVYTENNATATLTQTSPPICVDADGATHFQLSLDKINWSLPIPIDSYGDININLGFNRIYVRIYNENIPQDVRAFGSGNIGIFRLQP